MTTKIYACSQFVNNECSQWVQLSPFWVELSQLTYADTTVILGYTATIFTSAWLWKRLSLNASRM